MKAVDFQVLAMPKLDGFEYLVYALVPSRGGDGALIAVYDDEQAAHIFANLMNSMAKMHHGAALGG